VYYRLKQIDIDGQYSYTNIVSLSNIGSVEKSNSYKLYPNPSEGRFTIDGIESIKKIEISNACGNLVYKADGILNKYEIEGLGMGIYLVTIEDTHGIITRLKAIVK
jgi:hypothetical protein